MTHLSHDVPQTMVSLLTHAVGAFVLLVIFFIFRYIFELEFTCSCSLGGIHILGKLYMTIPPCVVYLLLYAMNKKYQRLFCLGPFKRVNGCCSFVVQQVLQLLSIALFWVAAVLMDGDWYVCYKGNQDEKHMKIPCTKKENLTYDENVFIIRSKNESIEYGLCLTLAGAVSWVLWLWVLIKGKCCKPYYQRLYEYHLSKETEKNLTAALIKIAQERSKAIIQQPIKEIREIERRPLETSTGNSTFSGDVMTAVPEDTWNSISELWFYESKRDESYEMSLFKGHLQKEKDVAIGQSLQDMAEDQASVTNQTRLEEFVVELTRDVRTPEQSAPTGGTDRQEPDLQIDLPETDSPGGSSDDSSPLLP